MTRAQLEAQQLVADKLGPIALQLCLAAAVSCFLGLLLHPPARPVWAAAAIGWIGWPLAVEPLCARVHFFDGGVDPRHHCCCVCAACALCIQTPCFQCPARFVCGRVVRPRRKTSGKLWGSSSGAFVQRVGLGEMTALEAVAAAARLKIRVVQAVLGSLTGKDLGVACLISALSVLKVWDEVASQLKSRCKACNFKR